MNGSSSWTMRNKEIGLQITPKSLPEKNSENRRGHQGRAAKTKNLSEASCWRREMPEWPNSVLGAWVLLTGFGNKAIKHISALLLCFINYTC